MNTTERVFFLSRVEYYDKIAYRGTFSSKVILDCITFICYLLFASVKHTYCFSLGREHTVVQCLECVMFSFLKSISCYKHCMN